MTSELISGEYHPPVDRTATQHEGTEELAVKDTLFYRGFTLLALQTAARFHKQNGYCIPISSRLIVKTGRFVHLSEAATMRFIAENTSIPVPKVYSAFVHKNRAYILMQRIKGETAASAWGKLSEDDRLTALAQLQRMIREMRTLAPPSPDVQSCVGGGRTLRDSRMPRSWPRFGPFPTIQAFHYWLREGLRPEAHPDREDDQDWKDIKEMVARQDGPFPPPVLTHGDLNPFNIIMRGNQVVAIIDWESAGWYPSYWEYTAAYTGNLIRPAWQNVVPMFINPYPDELQMEITRQRWYGEF